ncbi:MAG: MarR family transcriptional regulator [Henriciella sp.]
MTDQTANLLGAVGLAVTDQVLETAQNILSHSGQTPAALVVIGYGLGPSNDLLRRILGLSHPGTVRLVDRLVADGLVDRKKGSDNRTLALYLTEDGHARREQLLAGRLAAIKPFLGSLDAAELETFDKLLRKILSSMEMSDLERCSLCRLCDNRVCVNCPIPADFRG